MIGLTVPVPGVVAGGGVEELASVPSWAKGLGLPITASGVSTMLESCKLANAGLEKIVSSNFIFFTFNSSVRKSWGTTGALFVAFEPDPELSVLVGEVEVVGRETKPLGLEKNGLTRKT